MLVQHSLAHFVQLNIYYSNSSDSSVSKGWRLPVRELGFFSLPPHPEWLWDLPSLLAVAIIGWNVKLRVLRRIFRPKKDKVTRGWRNEKLHNLCSSPNIITMIKSMSMRWAGHVACMGEM
jgi:hypothetical protein